MNTGKLTLTPTAKIINNDARTSLSSLRKEFIDICFCSPNPPMMFKHGIGSEPSIDEYTNNLLEIFSLIQRLLKKEGSLWIQMADFHDPDGGESSLKAPLMTM
jgi:site-specific DNA-methyltransferase (adenine-specific)/site-specific DNA-methyltransferase (cytosine-N4-specific)